MATPRVTAWRKTHDLGAALGLDPNRIPVQYRQALENMLSTLPAAQAETVLQSLNEQLADQAFGDQQFVEAFSKAGGQVSLAKPGQQPSTGALTPQTAQLLGTPPQPSPYTASQQQASGTASDPAGSQGPTPSYAQPGQTAAAGGPTSGQSNLTLLAAYLGTTPEQVQQQYQGYVNAFAQHTRAGTTASGEDVRPLQIGDWVESSLTSLEGRNSLILNSYEAWYEQVYGAPMPGELRQRLRVSLQNLPPNAQGMVDQALASLSTPTAGGAPAPTAAAGAGAPGTATAPKAAPTPAAGSSLLKIGTSSSLLPFLDQSVSDYTASHVSSASMQDTVAKQRISYYYSAFNKLPDAATQAQLNGMTDPQFQQMINNVYTYYNVFGKTPDASMQTRLSGMSQTEMTAWQKNVTTLSQAWMDNFGKMPTPQQMTAASTMNGDALNEFINNSPSRVTGLNIGQFDGYKNALDPVYNKEFGGPAPDELVHFFHEAQSAG